jgi:DNA-binding transcriptional regulator YhcF (GntR family)
MDNTRHVQVPTMDLKAEGLANTDPYIYACIKKYMNTSTKQAWPSNSTLTKISGLSAKTVIAAINRLEQAGYISVKREYGKANVYTFNDYRKFEIFSYEFLDRTDLSPKEKAYFITVQPFMFKGDGTGTITFSTNVLAEKISLSVNTLKKYEQILKDKNLLELVPIKTDNATGLPVYARNYNFEHWTNLVAIKFAEQDDRLNTHEYELKRLKDEVQYLRDALKKQQIKDNAVIAQVVL